MSVRLGEGWLDRIVPPSALIEDETKRQVELDDLRQEQLLVALAALREALLELPPPVVHVDAPDLSAIVQAVTGLKPGADAQDIAAAVVAQISGQSDKQSLDTVLAKLVEKLEDLDFRMKGIGRQGSSGGGISDLTDRPLRQLGIVSVNSGYGEGGYGGAGGGLTDTELRATPVPVSGTVSVSNFPATQPVSIASTVPVSGTFWQATQPVSLATNTPDVTDRAARLLGHVTVDNASIPVTGPLTDTQLRASAVPVSGTFYQATQPVSGTVTDNQGTPNSVANAWPVKNTDGTNTAAVKAASTAAVATDPALVTSLSPNSPLPTGSNQIGTTLGPTLTKNTQGATGYSTQDLKDAGRSSKAMTAAFTSTAATETSISFQVSSAGGALAGAATSYTVTAGKTLRIQTVVAQIRAGGSAPAASLATFKIKVGGNQQGMAFMVAAPTTVAAGPSAFIGMLSGLNFPDGFEIAAGGVLSFTLTLSAWTSAVNTPIVDLMLVGYEY